MQCFLGNGACVESMSSPRPKYDRLYDSLTKFEDWNQYGEDTQYATLDQEYPSALRAAVRRGCDDVVHLLIRPRYRLHNNSIEYLRAIIAGATSRRLDFIKGILETSDRDILDFRKLGNEMLWKAVRFDHKGVVQWLLDNGVDVNACTRGYDHFQPRCNGRNGALEIAAGLNHTRMVRFLVDRGAAINVNPSFQFGIPIERPSKCGQDAAVDMLLEYGADPGKALPEAAFGGQTRLVKSLLNRFPDLVHRKGWVHKNGEVGRRAIHCAAIAGNLTIITMLVEARVYLQESNGYDYPYEFPLYYSKRRGYSWVVRSLLSLGAPTMINQSLCPRTSIHTISKS